MKKIQAAYSSGIRVICIVFLAIVAMCHLSYIWHDLHLGFSQLLIASGIGLVAGLIVAKLGSVFGYPFSLILLGVFVCYLVIIGYLVVWTGIPLNWLY